MKAKQVRKTYIDYFRSKGHELVDSDSLVPQNDPSLLFTNAGMVPSHGSIRSVLSPLLT